jgi:hypothetical protein
MKHLMMTTILIVATTSSFGLAQAPADHEGHHPPQATAPGQSAPTPGQSGMGGMPMMEMMRGMKDNMSMMNMMETMRSMRVMGPGGDGMGTIDRVEGRAPNSRSQTLRRLSGTASRMRCARMRKSSAQCALP